MADIYDRASELEEKSREIALQARKPEGPKATGYCLECDEALENGTRWCSAECRDRWQQAKRTY